LSLCTIGIVLVESQKKQVGSFMNQGKSRRRKRVSMETPHALSISATRKKRHCNNYRFWSLEPIEIFVLAPEQVKSF